MDLRYSIRLLGVSKISPNRPKLTDPNCPNRILRFINSLVCLRFDILKTKFFRFGFSLYLQTDQNY